MTFSGQFGNKARKVTFEQLSWQRKVKSSDQRSLTSSTGTTQSSVPGCHHKALTSNAISRGLDKPYPLQSCCSLGEEGCCEQLLLFQQAFAIQTCVLQTSPGHAPEAHRHSWSPDGGSPALGTWFTWFTSPGFNIFEDLGITQDRWVIIAWSKKELLKLRCQFC